MVFKKLCKELLKIADSCYSAFDITTLCKMRQQQVEIIFFLSKDVLTTQPFVSNHSSDSWLNPGAATIFLFLCLLAWHGLADYEAYLVKEWCHDMKRRIWQVYFLCFLKYYCLKPAISSR